MDFKILYQSVSLFPQMPQSDPDVLVIHLGGTDLNTDNCNAPSLADLYFQRFAGTARVVIFCAVVGRTNPRGVSVSRFRELATQFNQRLKGRTDGVSTIYFRHHHLHT